jgi:hypothetical protein
MTAQISSAAVLVSVLALPVLVLFKSIQYRAFARYARSPLFVAIAALALVFLILGGNAAQIGLCLAAPLLQIAGFALAALIYRGVTGRELAEAPFSAFVSEGKFALAIFDWAVGCAIVVVGFGPFILYEG